ncbi:MAG: amidohydrolase family protein [Candidatus Sumerlaeia bacterium]|nr:amidohydrolase family protein [Candidatus Sumerlaeia bacterium]
MNRLTRKNFLTATAGVALAGISEKSARPATPPPPRIIDCQSHLFMPELVARMALRKEDPTVYTKDGAQYVKMRNWHRRILPNHMDVAAKIADMDANGIHLTALSINDPGPEWFGDDGPAVAREANDFIAELVKRHPGRFLGLCVLPWQSVEASLAELDRCVNRLGMKGVLLYTNLAGRFADEPLFRPVFRRAVELNVPFLLHPALPVTSDQVEAYEMISSLGNMFDDTIALTRIIMSGMLDEMPTLKIICPHLGGTLPYIIGRLDHQTQVLKRGPKYLTRPPSAYLKQVWLDIVSPLPLAMKFAYDLVGADRLIFGSDHPWVDPRLILDGLRSLKLPPDDEAKILGGNAAKVFRLD